MKFITFSLCQRGVQSTLVIFEAIITGGVVQDRNVLTFGPPRVKMKGKTLETPVVYCNNTTSHRFNNEHKLLIWNIYTKTVIIILFHWIVQFYLIKW